MATSNTLLSPGVSVQIEYQGAAPTPSPTTVPLIFIATRANKQTPDGTGIALGTVESNVLRAFSSQADLLQAYGKVVFVTSDGVPIHGDETNEYGLLTAYMMCGMTNFVYIVRAPIDLGQLISTSVQPVLPPPDGTYWINISTVVGGILTYNGSVWSPVGFDIFSGGVSPLTDPSVTPISGSNLDGDWGFDYTTLNGTLIFRAAGVWYAATTDNIIANAGATDPLFVQSATPTGAVAGDFWYKTSSSGGGASLNLVSYRANDGVWVLQPIVYRNIAPTPVQNTIWCNTSQLATTGYRPLNIGTGTSFITLPVFVQAMAPVSAPPAGTLWYNNYFLDFAMYVEDGNIWVPVVTTEVSNPNSYQKVISDSPPQFPQQDAIWIDTGSSGTQVEIDNFPVVKRWIGGSTGWEDISGSTAPLSQTLYIQSIDPVASIVLNGSYWINTGELLTQNLVKMYDPTFVALTVNESGATVPQTGNFWAPQNGDGSNAVFGRKSQRAIVVDAMNEVIGSAGTPGNQDILAEVNYYQLIACPGYPETYQNISALNMEIEQIALAVFDIPKFVIPNGIPVGREVTIADWISDAQVVAVTSDQGFSGAGDPFQANAYPGGLATNPTDGNLVYVGPSHILLQCIAYNDSVAYPWYPPAGPNRGLVTSVSSVGYLDDNQNYVPLNMNRGQRDICYINSINPISNIPNVGLVLYGQKTMATAGIVLDRINVVRLVAKMKYDFQQLMQPFLFELNNATTQRNATIVAQRYLAGLAALNALYDYAVLCDSSNNTPDVVSAHQLIVDVAIQPELSIEFIYVPIMVLYPDQALNFTTTPPGGF